MPNSVVALMLLASFSSMAAGTYLFQKHIGGQPLLPYERRRRVPWGAGIALTAMALPLLNVVGYLLMTFNLIEVEPTEEPTSQSLLVAGWINFAVMVIIALGLAGFVIAMHRADRRDLGLPKDLDQFRRDVFVGVFAAVAALLPVYIVQVALILTIVPETQHPLVEQLEAHNSPALLIMSFVTAVIAAPLVEELLFRCLLQGWLESEEDRVLDFTATERPESIALQDAPIESDDLLSDEAAGPWLDADSAEEVPAAAHEVIRPAYGWLPDLPHGWTPVLISGFAFGLAHIGHGVSPIPLALFGVVLGYLYQRTHRLVPCIAAHMTFNGYSMILLWLQLRALPPG